MDFIRIAITPAYFYPTESKTIEQRLRSGEFDIIHIRKPEGAPEDIEHLIDAIDPALRPRLTLHDHYDLALRLGLGGIHGRDLPAAPAGIRRSASCHTIGEARQAYGYDYVFLSPIFPSFSKPGYRSDLAGNPDLSRMLSFAPTRVIALGGVTPDAITLLKDMGFGGAAMLGEAWRSPAMDLNRFRLQLITHPLPSLSIVDGAAEALRGGCRWIQLRHKDADAPTIIREGKAINALPGREDFTFLLDDHTELVEATGADGVHLGKNDMPVAQARRILGPEKIIGATANTLDDIIAAAQAGADYVGLGPFRFTTTKERLSPTLGIDGYTDIFRRLRALDIRIPIVAIGGITPDDCPAILRAGAQGVAVSGAILSSPDPAQAVLTFIDKLTPQNI